MDILQNNYIRIIFSSVAVYFFIILAIRLFGKKELAQLSVYDLVFILLISNAVQNAMVGPDSTLTGGLVAAGSLFVVNYILKQLQLRFPKFGKAIQGEAIIDVFFAEGTISVLISSAVRITDSIFTQKFHHFSFHFICSLHHRFHLLISLYSFPGNFIPSDVSTKFHSTHEFILNIFITDIFNITDLIF